ncbi:hypothetical protein Zmor_012518 [Zophobas morio]|uniref:Secreted protein n=1 Tax=Zophobas morio TaxID=2755281 RepID=A0AA38MEB6_9CUCU|nr:hypothetical protein Zmor_012518 [Zophobas morio]
MLAPRPLPHDFLLALLLLLLPDHDGLDDGPLFGSEVRQIRPFLHPSPFRTWCSDYPRSRSRRGFIARAGAQGTPRTRHPHCTIWAIAICLDQPSSGQISHTQQLPIHVPLINNRMS